MLHNSLSSLTLLLAPAQEITPRDWQVPSPDGEPTTVVFDGLNARRLIRGAVVETVDASAGPSAAACGSVSSSFLAAGSAPEGDTPTAAAFTPDATRIVVAHLSSRNLFVFDAATRAVLRVIPLSGSPIDVAVSSDNQHAATANMWEDTLSIVDLNAGVELATVAVGDQPACVRFTPSGAKLVVGNAVDQSLSVIDVAGASELFRIPGAGFASTTTISFEPGVVTYAINGFEVPSETLAVHPDNLHAQIDFFDLAAGTVSSVACDPQPRGIAMTPSGSQIVVSHFLATRRISVIDPATQTITKVITAPQDLNEPITIRPDGLKAAVSVQNATLVVDLVTNTFSAALNTASVNKLVSSPDGLYALGIGFNGSLISYGSSTIVKNLNGLVSTYAGAIAPSGQRAVMLANHNGENMLVANTNGAAGFLEANVPSGQAPEADATRDVELSQDGTLAVATHILSDTASVIDVSSGATLAIVAVGDRPADVAIAPDRSKAVVANLDSTFASVIDLTTYSVTSVPISTRGSEVEISPDSQYAYVAVVSGGDGVWRIHLPTNSVSGAKLPTGDMGSTGYMFNQTSGLQLSHDGATLAVCGSFTNQLTLIDTATWTVLVNVPVGSFPTEALFSADDSQIYVANKNANSLSVVTNVGAGSTVSATIAVGQQPFEMAVDSAAQRLFVCNFSSQNVGVVDLSSNTMTNTVAVTDYPAGLALSPSNTCLYAASGNWTVALGPGPKIVLGQSGALKVLDAATLAVAQTLTTALPPAAFDLEPAGFAALAPSPFGDGLTRFDVLPSVSSYCTSKLNSQGCTPPIAWSGTPSASAPSGFLITTSQLLPNKNGLLFYSTVGPAAVPFQGGWLCMQAPFERTGLLNSGGTLPCSGAFSFDFNAHIAGGTDPALVQGASFWGQFWSRDPQSASTTHLTDAVTATIGP